MLLDTTNPPSYYDTAAIIYNRDYFFLENIFSPLLEYSAGNEIVSGIAERFEWVGNEARFKMRTDLKTVDGLPINAIDAEQSLKRLFILGGSGYGFLSKLLCGKTALMSLQDPCPGLQVSDNGQNLVMKFAERKTFLFHLLTNITYAVIPRGSIDQKTFKINDYRNTSGPYYVNAYPGAGNIKLKANPFHYHYSDKIPQNIKIIAFTKYLKNEEILGMLSDKTIDYLRISAVLKPEDKVDFVAANPGYNIHLSRPVRMLFVLFTERGRRRLSREERFFIARKLRGLYPLRRRMLEIPDQIFQMEGGLSKMQLREIQALLNTGAEVVLKKKVEAKRLYSYFWLDGDEIKKWMPKVEYQDLYPPKSSKVVHEPDFYLFGCDMGFQDDVGLLAYYLDMDFFSMTPAEKGKWFADYIASQDKNARMRMIQALQYKTLYDARALPIGLLPYASVARKPWAFNYPPAIAGDALWRLRRNLKWTLK